MPAELSRFIVRHSRWLAAFCLASLAIPILQLPGGRVDNSIEVWISAQHPSYRDYQRFLARYGNEEYIVIATEWDQPFAAQPLARQRELADRIRRIAGVQEVLDLGSLAGKLAETRSDWQSFLLNDPLLRNLMIGPDGRTTGMFVWFKPMTDPGQRRIVVEQVEAAVTAAGFENEPRLAGTPVMNAALDRGSQDAAMKFLPATVALSILLLIFALRHGPGLAAILCSVAATVLWTVGLLFLTGRTLNMVTIVLPPLLFVLSLSGGIHLVSNYQAHMTAGLNRADALQTAIQELFFSIFLSCATTALGFASVMISDMTPVRDFGLFAAIGILFSFLFNFLLLPGILSLGSSAHANNLAPHPTHWTHKAAVLLRFPRATVAVAAGLTLLFTVVSFWSKAQANVLAFFPEESKIQRDYQAIARNLTGLYSVELDIAASPDQRLEGLAATQLLAARLEQDEQVAKVLHPGALTDFVGRLQLSPLALFQSGSQAGSILALMDRYQAVESDRQHWRLSVLVRPMAGNEFYRLQARIQSQVQTCLGGQFDCVITGIVPLLNDAQQALIDTQIRSFSLALATILGLIGLLLRSGRAMLAALLPNLLPIMALFALMVVCNIALDAATIMIAGIAVGIAADDTIHFLVRYRSERKKAESSRAAVVATFDRVGHAITLTSITAACGFAILILAPLNPSSISACWAA